MSVNDPQEKYGRFFCLEQFVSNMDMYMDDEYYTQLKASIQGYACGPMERHSFVRENPPPHTW